MKVRAVKFLEMIFQFLTCLGARVTEGTDVTVGLDVEAVLFLRV